MSQWREDLSVDSPALRGETGNASSSPGEPRSARREGAPGRDDKAESRHQIRRESLQLRPISARTTGGGKFDVERTGCPDQQYVVVPSVRLADGQKQAESFSLTGLFLAGRASTLNLRTAWPNRATEALVKGPPTGSARGA